jgi:hypothetical protein
MANLTIDAQLRLMAIREHEDRLVEEHQRRQYMEEMAFLQRNAEFMPNPWGRSPFGGWAGDDPDLSKAPLVEPDRKQIPRFGVALADEGESEAALAKEAEALLGYNVLRRKLKIPGKLGEVLFMLDIEPLNFEAVEKYKADMVLWRKKAAMEVLTAQQRRTYYVEVSWRRVALGKCTEEVPLFALRKAVQVKKACAKVVLEVDELIEEKKLIDPFLVARLDDEVYYLEVWKEPKFEETL